MASVSLRQDDFIEEFDGRVVRPGGFPFVDELVECLGLPQHVHIFAITMRDTAQKVVHVKVIDQTSFFALAGCWMHEFPVGIEERGEASYERGTHLVGFERNRADQCDGIHTSVMHRDAAPYSCQCLKNFASPARSITYHCI